MKKIIFLMMALVLISSAFAEDETTVEQEYLKNIKGAVLMEMATSSDRNSKFIALDIIEASIKGAKTKPQIVAALASLAGEGTISESRTNKKLVNNFTDIRIRACELLAKIPTKESKDALLKVLIADNDPIVVGTAIRSLGEIGINEDDEVVNAITWCVRRFDLLNPTSSLAADMLFTIEKFFPTVKNPKTLTGATVMILTNHRYSKGVRDKAQELLKQWSVDTDE